MFATQRQRQILDALSVSGRVSVSDLAEQLQVTTETIRRDLEQLAASSLLVRVHGGAVARRTAVVEPDLATRAATNTEAKARIGAAAAALLPADPATSIMVDAGTTTGALAPHLRGRRGPVIVNSPALAQTCLTGAGELEVRMLPGRLRGSTHAAVGAETVAAIGALNPDVAVLGCNGLGPEGLTTPDPDEAAVKAAMISGAGLRIVLADSSKIGDRQLVTFAALDEIDVLVTDAALPSELAALLAGKDIEVVVA